jgi:hypothetical protein
MIFGLFATSLGKGTAAEDKSGPSTSGQSAVLESPGATGPNPGAPSQSALAALQAAAKTASAASSAAADPSKPEAKACPQCGSTEPWGISSWCPNCFYHPRLGQPVAAPPPDPEVREFLPGNSGQSESLTAVLKSIPVFVHVLWIGVVAIFVLSVCATLKLPKGGCERAILTLAQASIGLIAAGTAHVLVFFKAIPNTDKYGPFDLLFKPFDFWRYAIHKLPTGAWQLWLVAWGLTAAFAAIVLIGGVRYSVLFETKSTKKKGTWYETSQIAPGERQAISVWNG